MRATPPHPRRVFMQQRLREAIQLSRSDGVQLSPPHHERGELLLGRKSTADRWTHARSRRTVRKTAVRSLAHQAGTANGRNNPVHIW